MSSSTEPHGRCILYYPTIDIPNSSWLRKAALYWDQIGSIIPNGQDLTGYVPISRDLQLLYDQGMYRPFNPSRLLQGPYRQFEAFQDEFKAIFAGLIESHQYGDNRTFRIHQNKVSFGIYEYLRDRGLAARSDTDTEWLQFEERAALLYLGLLAKYLALTDREYTTVGTDWAEYENLIFYSRTKGNDCAYLATGLIDALPMPTADTPLNKIVKFKVEHRDELMRFRAFLDKYLLELSKSSGVAETKQLTVAFQEQLQVGVHDLESALKSVRIRTMLGSITALVKIESPTLWGTIGIVANQAAKIVDLPLSWSLFGIGAIGAIQVAIHILDRIDQGRSIRKGSPLSFLLEAREAGVAG